jgi:hypothetical protein
VAPPSGARIRTRLRIDGVDEVVLREAATISAGWRAVTWCPDRGWSVLVACG